MASEEARFVARAQRLAGPTNRYVMPQFSEKTPYGMKTMDAYSRLFEDRIIFLGVQVDDTSADDIMAQLLVDRKSTRLNPSHWKQSRMPSSA